MKREIETQGLLEVTPTIRGYVEGSIEDGYAGYATAVLVGDVDVYAGLTLQQRAQCNAHLIDEAVELERKATEQDANDAACERSEAAQARREEGW